LTTSTAWKPDPVRAKSAEFDVGSDSRFLFRTTIGRGASCDRLAVLICLLAATSRVESLQVEDLRSMRDRFHRVVSDPPRSEENTLANRETE
jgi:hypothetical protein